MTTDINGGSAPATTTKMEELAAQMGAIPAIGDTVDGIIIESNKNEVLVDLGPLGLGTVRGRELSEVTGSADLMKVGEKISASILELENENGHVELSFKQASMEKAWEDLKAKYKSGEVFQVKIGEVNKGGLIAYLSGIPAFMPVSQLTTEHYPKVAGGDKNEILRILKSFIRKELTVKVIDINQAEEKIIISEKAAVAEQNKDRIKELKVGDVVDGVVSGTVDFGAFIKFGGDIEGLVHISEISWQRVNNPEDILKVGAEVKAKIIGIEGTRISLSIKQLERDPWLDDTKDFKVDQLVKGEITKLNPFGAFVKLNEKVQGLAHISEIGEYLKPDAPAPLKIGDQMEFKIISIEPKDHRIGLAIAKEEPKKEQKEATADADATKVSPNS